MTKAELALENSMNVTWSPEAPVSDRIAKFRTNLLTRLEALEDIEEADFELAA